MTDWYKHKLYLPPVKIKISEAEGTYWLREGWKRVYNKYPENKQLALLWAQTMLETGRFSVQFIAGNFGNIKKKHESKYNKDDGHYFTMFRCSEVLNGKEHWFDPPHLQTHFRAYKSILEGAEDYIRFLSQRERYKKAWDSLMKGDVENYVKNLKNGGYFTASLSLYLKGVQKLVDEFHKKSDKLLSWKPEFPKPIPETKLEDIFTAEEKSQILQSVNKSVDEFIQNWFDSNRNSIDDDFDYVKIEKKSWWQSIKSRLKL